MKCKENGSFGTILRTFSYFFPLLQWRYFLGKFGEIELVLILTNDLNEACPLAFIFCHAMMNSPFFVCYIVIDRYFLFSVKPSALLLIGQPKSNSVFTKLEHMKPQVMYCSFFSWNSNLEELSMFATLGDGFCH